MTARMLNRATLQRQWLLDRPERPVLAAVRHLVALNAQNPNPPYLTLWSRLRTFDLAALTSLIERRDVVRSSLLRGTQHLSAATDYRWLRPLLHPVLVRGWRGAFGRQLTGVDLADVAAVAERALRAAGTLTRPQLRDVLVEHWPEHDPLALGWSVQALLPVVHPPPPGLWNMGGATRFALAEEWLGVAMAADPGPDELVRRYLAAFGPATVKDVQAWSGLTRLREVVDRLRPTLRIFRSEDGAELFDLADAPLPAPDVPAPVRLLPDFDNLMLAHADRRRVMTDAQRRRVCAGAATAATVLVDGSVAGIWTLRRDDEQVVMDVEPLATLSAADRSAVAHEAHRLLEFVHPDLQHRDVRIADRR
jgi:Winged helix DNA-binding domain